MVLLSMKPQPERGRANLVSVTRDFAVKIERHAALLHGTKDIVVDFVVFDSTIRIGGDASRVALDARNAGLVRLSNLGRSDRRVKVKRHEEGRLGSK